MAAEVLPFSPTANLNQASLKPVIITFAEKPPPELDIFRSAKMLNSDGFKAMQTEEFKMGENTSSGALASGRGMAKLAAAMADQGAYVKYPGTVPGPWDLTTIPWHPLVGSLYTLGPHS